MPTYRISKVARTEILDAFDYLKTQGESLPKKLAREIRNGLHTIIERPHYYPFIFAPYRKLRLDPFKYALIYQELPDGDVEVVSLWHLMQNEERLKRRLKP